MYVSSGLNFALAWWPLAAKLLHVPRLASVPAGLAISATSLRFLLRYHSVEGIPARRPPRRDDGKGERTVKVKRKVERAVRKALGGAVAGDPERLDDAVMAINDSGQSFSAMALDLAFLIGSTALRSIHHGDRPSDRQLRVLAKDFAGYEAWSGIDASTAHRCLVALADRDSFGTEPAAHPRMVTAFVVAGWLLSAFIPDDVDWTDFLDGVLDRLESAPAH